MKKLFTLILLSLAIAGYGQTAPITWYEGLMDKTFDITPQYDTSECWIMCHWWEGPKSYDSTDDLLAGNGLEIDDFVSYYLMAIIEGYVVREYILTEDIHYEEVYIGDYKSYMLTCYPTLTIKPESFIALLDRDKQPLDSSIVVWDWKLKEED